MCFACGQNNPIGLRLKFELIDGKYTTKFTPRTEHQGYDDITHGGIVSTLLDEAMAKLVWSMGRFAVTADLKVRFKKRALVGEELTVTGWVKSETRRLLSCAAEARNPRGELIAEAEGTMVEVSQVV